MATLLKDVVKPNLVQTLEGNPVLMHGGPFANIAQGTNTIIATQMGLKLADYAVTEAGFGFDLGGEKFLDIKCRAAGLKPALVVIVATIRALKYHGGKSLDNLQETDVAAVKAGMVNLEKHLENATKFGLKPLVAINEFSGDAAEEVAAVVSACAAKGVKAVSSTAWSDGGNGAKSLAAAVVAEIEKAESNFKVLYDLSLSMREKIQTIAKEIYGAASVEYSSKALKDLRKIADLGLESLPVCMAKTQKSLSDNPKLIGRPKDFVFAIRGIEIAAGAGFVVPLAGDIMRMPGLPRVPAAQNIDIDAEGNISGLF